MHRSLNRYFHVRINNIQKRTRKERDVMTSGYEASTSDTSIIET